MKLRPVRKVYRRSRHLLAVGMLAAGLLTAPAITTAQPASSPAAVLPDNMAPYITAQGTLVIPTPAWAEPLLAAGDMKGAKGGRSSGKSHFFAERLVEHHIADPDFSSVCIREVQKSLKYSAKRLVESKIRSLGVKHLFIITNTEIRRVGGSGVILFQGMQDHTADSIKSLEAFNLAWCEESQSLSQRSIELLIPTIRTPSAGGICEVWFSWNPDQPTDPVDKLLLCEAAANDPGVVVVHTNYTDNPHCPAPSKKQARKWLERDPDTFPHVWLGEYNTKADDQVLAGRWSVGVFEPGKDWDGPYFGADWGFSTDPNTLIKCWVYDNVLYIHREAYGEHVEITDTPTMWRQIQGAASHVIRADNARPEMVSHMQRNGYPRTVSVDKWPGSVEDGITTLRGFDAIVIHEGCLHTIEEARLWKYKRDKQTGDVLPVLIDKNNHCWDAIRYAISPLIKRGKIALAW